MHQRFTPANFIYDKCHRSDTGLEQIDWDCRLVSSGSRQQSPSNQDQKAWCRMRKRNKGRQKCDATEIVNEIPTSHCANYANKVVGKSSLLGDKDLQPFDLKIRDILVTCRRLLAKRFRSSLARRRIRS